MYPADVAVTGSNQTQPHPAETPQPGIDFFGPETSSLSDEIVLHILERLDYQTIATMRLASPRLARLGDDHALWPVFRKAIWRNFPSATPGSPFTRYAQLQQGQEHMCPSFDKPWLPEVKVQDIETSTVLTQLFAVGEFLLGFSPCGQQVEEMPARLYAWNRNTGQPVQPPPCVSNTTNMLIRHNTQYTLDADGDVFVFELVLEKDAIESRGLFRHLCHVSPRSKMMLIEGDNSLLVMQARHTDRMAIWDYQNSRTFECGDRGPVVRDFFVKGEILYTLSHDQGNLTWQTWDARTRGWGQTCTLGWEGGTVRSFAVGEKHCFVGLNERFGDQPTAMYELPGAQPHRQYSVNRIHGPSGFVDPLVYGESLIWIADTDTTREKIVTRDSFGWNNILFQAPKGASIWAYTMQNERLFVVTSEPKLYSIDFGKKAEAI